MSEKEEKFWPSRDEILVELSKIARKLKAGALTFKARFRTFLSWFATNFLIALYALGSLIWAYLYIFPMLFAIAGVYLLSKPWSIKLILMGFVIMIWDYMRRK